MTPKAVRLASFVALVLLVMLLRSTPASAEDYHCFKEFNDCLWKAVFTGSYWDGILATLDCELTLVACLREVFGW